MGTQMPERSVLHVLPHPGGGGETYVDTLETMEGYAFTRAHLAPGPRPSGALAVGVTRALREARRHDLLHVHGEVAAGLFLPAIAARPSVVTLHGLNLLRRARGVGRRAAVVNLQLIVRTAGRTICVSQSEHHDVSEVVGADRVRRVVVIPNGVELPALPTKRAGAAARAELGVDDSVTVALWIGSLDSPKEPEAPVRAAIEVARGDVPIHLFLAGEGPLRGAVEELRRSYPEAVTVLGFRRDMRTLLAAADLFVLSSRREGLPFSLLEAMSMGLPAVVTAVGGSVEAVGEAGIAVAPGDSAGFADAFRRLTASPDERAALGRSARDRVAVHFCADEMIERTREVYERVLLERRRL